MESIVIIIIMGGMIVYQGITNYIEKQKATKRENDLLNRIMSRNFFEYAEGNVRLEEPPKSEKLAELEEEIKMNELKEMQDTYPVT